MSFTIENEINSGSFDSHSSSTDSSVAEKLYCSGTFELDKNIDLTQSTSSVSGECGCGAGAGGRQEKVGGDNCDHYENEEHYSVYSLQNENNNRHNNEVMKKNNKDIDILSLLCSSGSYDQFLIDDYGLSLSFESDDDDDEINIDSKLDLIDDYYNDRMYDKVAIEKGLLDITFEEIFHENTTAEEKQTFMDVTSSFLNVEMHSDAIVGSIHDNHCIDNDPSVSSVSDSNDETSPFGIIENVTKSTGKSLLTLTKRKSKFSPQRTTILCRTKKALSFDGITNFERRKDSNAKKYKNHHTKVSLTDLDYEHLLSTFSYSCDDYDDMKSNDYDGCRVDEVLHSSTSKLSMAKKLMKKLKKRRDQTYIQIDEVDESRHPSPPCMTKINDHGILTKDWALRDNYDYGSLRESKQDFRVVDELQHHDSFSEKERLRHSQFNKAIYPVSSILSSDDKVPVNMSESKNAVTDMTFQEDDNRNDVDTLDNIKESDDSKNDLLFSDCALYPVSSRLSSNVEVIEDQFECSTSLKDMIFQDETKTMDDEQSDTSDNVKIQEPKTTLKSMSSINEMCSIHNHKQQLDLSDGKMTLSRIKDESVFDDFAVPSSKPIDSSSSTNLMRTKCKAHKVKDLKKYFEGQLEDSNDNTRSKSSSVIVCSVNNFAIQKFTETLPSSPLKGVNSVLDKQSLQEQKTPKYVMKTKQFFEANNSRISLKNNDHFNKSGYQSKTPDTCFDDDIVPGKVSKKELPPALQLWERAKQRAKDGELYSL